MVACWAQQQQHQQQNSPHKATQPPRGQGESEREPSCQNKPPYFALFFPFSLSSRAHVPNKLPDDDDGSAMVMVMMMTLMMEYYFPSFTQGKKHGPRTRSFHLVRTLAPGGRWIEQAHHTHASALPQSESTIRCRVRVDQSFLSPPLLAMAMVGERPATHNGIAERDGFSFTHLPPTHTKTEPNRLLCKNGQKLKEKKQSQKKQHGQQRTRHSGFRVRR